MRYKHTQKLLKFLHIYTRWLLFKWLSLRIIHVCTCVSTAADPRFNRQWNPLKANILKGNSCLKSTPFRSQPLFFVILFVLVKLHPCLKSTHCSGLEVLFYPDSTVTAVISTANSQSHKSKSCCVLHLVR